MDDHLTQVRLIAVRHRMRCIGVEGRGVSANYRFRCHEGHVLERTGASVLKYERIVCKACVQAECLERVRKTARALGGDCLDSRFQGARPHRFICSEGHVWSARAYQLHKGRWCPECRGNRPRLSRQSQRARVGNGTR